MATLKESREKLEAKQAALAAIFEKAKRKGLGQYDFAALDDEESKSFFGEAKDSTERVKIIQQKNDELNDLVDEAEKLSKAEKDWESVNGRLDKAVKTFPHPTGKEKKDGEREFKSLGEEIAQSEEYTKWGKKGGLDFRFDEMYPSDALAKAGMIKTLGMKALMATTSGYGPESIRIPGFIEAVMRPIQLLDIIPLGRTSYENVVYMEETTRTHAAAEKAEGVTFAESTFAFTERTSAVRKITDSLPVTDEQLEDVPFIEGYINDRLLFGLRQRLDTQVLLGDGAAPNLRGIKNVVG
ncbi:MAG: phage major capsid protein, partial [Thermodesulfobacteriota bacterium]